MKQPRPRTIGAFCPVSVPKPLGAASALEWRGGHFGPGKPAAIQSPDRRGVHSPKVEIHINHTRGVCNAHSFAPDSHPTAGTCDAAWPPSPPLPSSHAFARELNSEIRRALSLVSRLAAALSFAREGWRPALVKVTALSDTYDLDRLILLRLSGPLVPRPLFFHFLSATADPPKRGVCRLQVRTQISPQQFDNPALLQTIAGARPSYFPLPAVSKLDMFRHANVRKACADR